MKCHKWVLIYILFVAFMFLMGCTSNFKYVEESPDLNSQTNPPYEEIYAADGSLEKTIYFDYNAEGQLMSAKTLDSLQKLISTTIYEYSLEGNLKRESTYDEMDKLTEYRIYEYDEKGKVTAVNIYNNEDKLEKTLDSKEKEF